MVQAVFSNWYAPTDLSISYNSTPSFSGSAETDLIFQEQDSGLTIPSSSLGITWCDNAQSSTTHGCDQTYMRLRSPDGYRIFAGSVTCHEIGHAVGLLHGPNSAFPDGSAVGVNDIARLGCMVNENDYPAYLSTDEAHQIDLTY